MVRLLRIFRFSSEVHKQEALLRAEHECQWHGESPTRNTSHPEGVYNVGNEGYQSDHRGKDTE
jgi:hypothetical protein